MFAATTNRAFMRGLDLEERKRARQNGRFLLRKKNREELFSKRRKCILGVAADCKTPEGTEEVDVEQYLSQLQEFRAKMGSHDPSQRLLGISSLRKLVAMEEHPALHQILEAEVLQAAVRLVADHDKQIQLQAAWFLTNMATGSRLQTIEVIRVGTIPAFKQAMVNHRSNRLLMFQCVWGIGNLLGDGILEAYKQALAPEVLNVIGDMVNAEEDVTPDRVETLSNASWCLLNFCRDQHPIPRECAQQIMELLCTCREKFSEIHEVAQNVLYALQSISDANEQLQQGVLSHGIRLVDWCRFGLSRATTLAVQCLDSHNPFVFVALRTIGNLLLAEDEIIEQIWRPEIVPRIMNLLRSENIGQVRESLILCSNILVSIKYEELISTELINILIKLRNHERAAVQREAIQCMGNLLIDADFDKLLYCVKKGVVESTVIKLLETASETKWVELGLLMLKRILAVGEDMKNKTGGGNGMVPKVEKAGAVSLLEKIQGSDVVSERLFNLAASLVLNYFSGELEGNDQVVNPNDGESCVRC